jgi:branched-chain amino acid transport system ATP-binding protein
MGFLEIRKLTRYFGGLIAVSELDIDVGKGSIFGLIGPNGAGKSTLLNMIDGSLRASRGEIVFDGAAVTKLPPHRRAQRGMARVFQQNVLFNSFTVCENVQVGCHLQSKITPSSIFLRTSSEKMREKAMEQKAIDTLDFVGLRQYANELAVNLPHGSQRVLALAIALVSQPRLLLLDEPLTGMNAEEVETMLGVIRLLREQRGITCVLVEHNLKAVMGLCDRLAVLNFGKKIAEGSPDEIIQDPEVMEAYLGREEDGA